MKSFVRSVSIALMCTASVLWAGNGKKTDLPDKSNPAYLYCNDFESAEVSGGLKKHFTIAGKHGIRQGAGYKSNAGYSNLIKDNSCMAPYPTVPFPKHDGIVFVHFNLKTPEHFYLGRSNHGYYLYNGKNKRFGMVVMDTINDHPSWLDEEWDPYSVFNMRGSGYHRIVRSFEGVEPKRRGEWHSYQMMIVPSQKDPKVGRIKVWVDGELAFFCKTDTIPSYDTFWISNYWHSHPYAPSNDGKYLIYEGHTAPLHPAFEIQLDNLIISKSFIEFDSNKAQIERVKFTKLTPNSFRVHFDTTVPAKQIRASWVAKGHKRPASVEKTLNAGELGYFHTLDVAGLKPNRDYVLTLKAKGRDGRVLATEECRFSTHSEAIPTFDFPGWTVQAFAGHGFRGTPIMVRNFDSLSNVMWPGLDADDAIDMTQPMSVRYTKRQQFKKGEYTFQVLAYDGVQVKVDGEVKANAMRKTQGHAIRRDFAMPLKERHTITVEHTMWRDKGQWDAKSSKYLCFRVLPKDKEPPRLLAPHAIYSSRCHKPDQPFYCGRWNEYVHATVEFGPTKAYGQSAKGRGRHPWIKLGKLELGKTYHWRIIAVDLMGNKTVTPDATFTCGDTVPPARFFIKAEKVSETSSKLIFHAPGEDGNYGIPASYDVRWSTKPITVANWQNATKMVNPPAPKKGRQEILVESLPANKRCHFAMKAIDKGGNKSLISNIASNSPVLEVLDVDGDGYGIGCPNGIDPDDYDASIPGRTIGSKNRQFHKQRK